MVKYRAINGGLLNFAEKKKALLAPFSLVLFSPLHGSSLAGSSLVGSSLVGSSLVGSSLVGSSLASRSKLAGLIHAAIEEIAEHRPESVHIDKKSIMSLN